MQETLHIFKKVIQETSNLPGVSAIGMSGGNEKLPKYGEGDIDIFVYCSEIPTLEMREEMLEKLSMYIRNEFIEIQKNPNWGSVDVFRINGVPTWLMFFSDSETLDYIQAVLRAEHIEKENNYFYPVGRCAMFKQMKILHDPNGFIKNIKELVEIYPEPLAKKMMSYHLLELDDFEDLLRAVALEDVLFYHSALDKAMDHFLLALFALNRQYFPSRKRSWELINKLLNKPMYCENRLLDVVKLGATDVTLKESYDKWSDLVNELQELCDFVPFYEELV